MDRLHGLVDNAPQVVAERVEIDLIAQTGAERLEPAHRVVLAPEEAAVDAGLDPAPRGLEQRGDGERRARDGEPAASRQAAEDELQQQHAAEIRARERRRQRAVDERPVDDHVDSYRR